MHAHANVQRLFPRARIFSVLWTSISCTHTLTHTHTYTSRCAVHHCGNSSRLEGWPFTPCEVRSRESAWQRSPLCKGKTCGHLAGNKEALCIVFGEHTTHRPCYMYFVFKLFFFLSFFPPASHLTYMQVATALWSLKTECWEWVSGLVGIFFFFFGQRDLALRGYNATSWFGVCLTVPAYAVGCDKII